MAKVRNLTSGSSKDIKRLEQAFQGSPEIDDISELIGLIYEAPLNNSWAGVLATVREAVGANKAFIVFQNVTESEPQLLQMLPNFLMPKGTLDSYRARVLEDPFFHASQALTEGDTENFNTLVDIESHRGSHFFEEVLTPARSYYTMGGVLCRDGRHESFYAVNRGEDEAPFSEANLALMRLITPHLSRAIHIYKELNLYKKQQSISKSVMDQTDSAIIVCDHLGRVLNTNRAARERLAPPFGVFIQDGSVYMKDSTDHQRLRSYIEQCALMCFSGIHSQETILLESSDNQQAVITVSPIHQRSKLNDFSQPCAMVTVSFQCAVNWSQVQTEFCLTPKELALLKGLHRQIKLADLAANSEVTYNTVRSHLQAVFRKLGVSSQTDLMIKLGMFRH